MRKKLFWACLIIVLVIVVIVGLNYRNSFRKVYINLGTNIDLSIYKNTCGKTDNCNVSKPSFKLVSSQTITLKEGVYSFVVNDPSHQYANPITEVTVTSQTNSLTINPFYSSQKLASLLSTERSAIQQVLISQYPLIPSYYTITPDSLYEYGNWYGAVLKPSGAQYDTLRVIMDNNGGHWVLAAKPQIIISIPANPSIPSDVIDSVDQL